MNYNQSYGCDILSIILLLISAILNLFSPYIIKLLSIVILFLAVYRCFSHNNVKRRAELQKYYIYMNKLLGKFNKQITYNYNTFHISDLAPAFNSLKYKASQKIKYKIVKCPQCNQKLRLPRRKGKITVTCKKCRSEFKMRT